MCGIFGYVGKGNASKNIINGLKRLEYRGYDSWGVAIVENTDNGNVIKITKKVGAIGDLTDLNSLPESTIGIGHTRWATHGGVTNANAHPHYSTDSSFVLAQNGIVENYQELKKMLLEKGYEFHSQTDTEVIVRLIEEKQKDNLDLKSAVREAFLELKGRNTIILLSSKDKRIIAVKNGSPLVIGIGKDEYFFASDTLSFADKTNKVLYMNDFELVEYKNGKINLSNVKTKTQLPLDYKILDHEAVEIDKDGYEYFMIKEIIEQKYTIREAVQYSEEELSDFLKALREAKTVYTVGAGTANFAASEIAYYLRKYANLIAIELKSYEVDSYKEIFCKDDLILAVSQSGETADTIEALEFAKEKGVTIASVVNMVGSTISRMSQHAFFSRSGPEICVASTKSFTSQIAWGLLIAKSLVGKYSEMKKIVEDISTKLESYFNDDLLNQVQQIAKMAQTHEHFFVLGRGQNFYISLEAALKVKEISYKHFEGFAGGELKHGVIALLEKGTPVFVIASNDNEQDNMLAVTAEVKSRGAWVIGVGQNNNDLFDNYIQTIDTIDADSLTNIIPFQLLSYYLALELGLNPDKPRNLAKSVTVK